MFIWTLYWNTNASAININRRYPYSYTVAIPFVLTGYMVYICVSTCKTIACLSDEWFCKYCTWPIEYTSKKLKEVQYVSMWHGI